MLFQLTHNVMRSRHTASHRASCWKCVLCPHPCLSLNHPAQFRLLSKLCSVMRDTLLKLLSTLDVVSGRDSNDTRIFLSERPLLHDRWQHPGEAHTHQHRDCDPPEPERPWHRLSSSVDNLCAQQKDLQNGGTATPMPSPSPWHPHLPPPAPQCSLTLSRPQFTITAGILTVSVPPSIPAPHAHLPCWHGQLHRINGIELPCQCLPSPAFPCAMLLHKCSCLCKHSVKNGF